MKHNKKREYEQAPLGFVWVEGREERGRVFRLEECRERKKKHKAFLTEEKMNRGKKGREGGGKVTTLAKHRGPRGSLPGGRELLKGKRMSCADATLPAKKKRSCRSGWTLGTEASSRESLSADLELRRLPLPSAIIHRRRTPREADDGCLACGPF